MNLDCISEAELHMSQLGEDLDESTQTVFNDRRGSINKL